MYGIANASDMSKKFLLEVLYYNLHQHLMDFKDTILKVQDDSRFRVFKRFRNISTWAKSTLSCCL